MSDPIPKPGPMAYPGFPALFGSPPKSIVLVLWNSWERSEANPSVEVLDGALPTSRERFSQEWAARGDLHSACSATHHGSVLWAFGPRLNPPKPTEADDK